MIKIENITTCGWESAFRGMRAPLQSWAKSDSYFYPDGTFSLGEADLNLAKRLVKAGAEPRKFLRFIHVQMDIIMPAYVWAEFDTYKVGTVRNSCSKMHKIHSKELLNEDFSCEGCREIGSWATLCFVTVQNTCNKLREKYNETKEKKYWRALIELLPESYNQRATVQLNYEVLTGIYRWRKDHKLDEWHTFCEWIESLPYSEIITGGSENGED